MTNADEILTRLDPEQREVAASPLGPMCVLAGAGTGKTRAITHRIAYGVHSGAYQAQRVLAVTFTARAAGEMRTRLRGLGVPGVQARTFHAAALRQLHYFWPEAVGGPPPELVKVKAPLVGESGNRLRLDLDRPSIRDLASEIEWAKVSMLTPETYADAARRAGHEPAGYDPTVAARVYETYEQVKGERGLIDFEDVLLLLVGILEDRDDVARAVRAQYRHFVVDEYQDVNAVQQRLLRTWLGERSDLCVVGDPAQTIYSFTGASPQHLLRFSQDFPQAMTVRLVRNYRSTPQVVEVANAVVSAGARRSGIAPLQLVAQGAPGAAPRLTVYPDDPAEADGIAALVAKEIAAGTPANEIAVLYRTNAQSEAFESALASRQVPYLVHGGERFFNRPEVRRAMLLLRGATRASADEPLVRQVGSVLAGEGWTAEPPGQGGAVRERWESLQAIVDLAVDLVGDVPGAAMGDLVEDLQRRASEQHAPTVAGVTLASLHAAKGLEWDVVFLAGLSDGLVPISMADGPDAVEEERRLLYVGLTRARRRLELSYALARSAGGRSSRKPSRFLAAAERLLGAGAVPPRAPEHRVSASRGAKLARHCRTCNVELDTPAERKIGRCADCPPTYDEAVFEQLRTWRLATATEEKVPAYCVFTDATLTAIAERSPSSQGELAGISGVGQRKLTKYGPAVLAILAGENPQVSTRE